MYEDLLSSKHFCILPFVHAHISTTGRSQVCCMSEESFGDVTELGIENIYSKSNSKLVNFRKDMLEHGLPASCANCSVPEEFNNTSHRITSNRQFGHLLDNMGDLVNNEDIFLWDVRFSNLCNLKCRMCGPQASTRIAEEQNVNNVLIKPFSTQADFFEFFIKHIDTATEFYFCGGEPLMMEEHYRVLDLLIEHKKFDTVLRYNSNMTTLCFKDKNVINYWKHFKQVKVSASIDAGWTQLSYIRHGANWKNIVDNLKSIRYSVTHVEVILGVAVSILNAFHVFSMYKFLVEHQLIKAHEIYFIPVHGNMSLTCLPPALKEKVTDYWHSELSNIKEQNVLNSGMALLNEMNSTDNRHMLSNFITEIKDIDTKRNENFLEVFPELKEIYYGN